MNHHLFYLLGKAMVVEYRRKVAYHNPGGKPYDGGPFDGKAAQIARDKWKRAEERRLRLFWKASDSR